VIGGMRGKPLQAIQGSPPDLSSLPPGCSFAPRCAEARPECVKAMPDDVVVAPGHRSRCVLAQPVAA
jgi:peptide/nickel transport system ATP-binding protein